MNKNRMVFGLFLLAAFVLSMSGAAIAEDTQYEAYNITIQPGSDATVLNVTWFTTDLTDVPKVIVCPKDAMNGEEFPESAVSFEGAYEIVDVETSGGGGSGGGPGGGPGGGGGFGTMSTTAEEEEEDATIYSCKVTVTDVTPSTEYAYVVGDGENFSDMYYVETKDTDNYNFIFVGDPQIGASRDADTDAEGWTTTVTAALTEFDDTGFIFSAGDQVESATSTTQYDGFFSADEFTSVPFAPAIGNHDTSDLYAYHFNVSNESELGSSSGGGDYWFTYGKTLFMVLNTNNSSATAHSDFMAEAIEANDAATWKVVVFHHSLYSSASHVSDVSNLRSSLYPVMDEHDIDVVLSGHDHFYARTYQLYDGAVVEDDPIVDDEERVVAPGGTVYFTANSASGSKYYDFSYIEGYTNYYLAEYAQLNTPTYLNVEVKEVENGNTFTVSAYRTDTGDMFDSYTILKLTGDLNEDGVVDRSDVSIIRGLLRQPASVNPAADLDGDGTITILDARLLISLCS